MAQWQNLGDDPDFQTRLIRYNTGQGWNVETSDHNARDRWLNEGSEPLQLVASKITQHGHNC